MPTSNYRNPYSTDRKYYLKETDIAMGLQGLEKKPEPKKEDTGTKLPRIHLKDKLGYRLDTLTTFQNNIYQAELKVRNVKEPMTAEEWRLPIAPLPARPDYSRTEPIFSKSRKSLQKHVHPHVTTKSTPAPPLPYTGADVGDVAFVAESLNHLPHLPSLSFLRQELILPPKTYFQFAHHVYFHNKYLTETDRREAVYHFPGFCSGCQRYSLCYGCERSSEPHYHLDGRHKHADGDHWPGYAKGYGTDKHRHPLSENMDKFMKEHGLTPEQLEMLEQEAQRLMRQKSLEERTGSLLPRIPDSDADIISAGHKQARHRADDNATEDEGIMTDKNSMVNTEDGDHQVSPSGYRSDQSSRDLQGSIDIDMADRRVGTEGDRQYESRGSTAERHLYGDGDGMARDLEEGRDSQARRNESRGQRKSQQESIGDSSSKYSYGSYRHGYRDSSSKYSYDSPQRTTDEDDENLSPSPSSKSSNSKRRRFYRAPPPFKIKKRQRKALKSRSPFSTERTYNIPKGSGFQLKQGERRVTEFEEFKRKDIDWKPPPKYELKRYETKKTEFWTAPQTKDKSKKNKQRDKHRRPTSPDSGLDSEKTSDGGNSDRITTEENYEKRYGRQKKQQINVRIPRASDNEYSSSEDTDINSPPLSLDSSVCLTSSEPDLELSFNDVIEVNKLEVSPENQRKHKHKKRRRKQVETQCEDNKDRINKTTQSEDLNFTQQPTDQSNADKDAGSMNLLTGKCIEETNHGEKNEDDHHKLTKRSAGDIESSTEKHKVGEEKGKKIKMLNKRRLNSVDGSRTTKDDRSFPQKIPRKHKIKSPVDFDKLPSIPSMLQKILSGTEVKSRNTALGSKDLGKESIQDAAFLLNLNLIRKSGELDATTKELLVQIKDDVCSTHNEASETYVEVKANRKVADLGPPKKIEDYAKNEIQTRRRSRSVENLRETASTKEGMRRHSLPAINHHGYDLIPKLNGRSKRKLRSTKNIILPAISRTMRPKKTKVKNPKRVGNMKMLKRLEEAEELELRDNAEYMEDVECSFMSKHPETICAENSQESEFHDNHNHFVDDRFMWKHPDGRCSENNLQADSRQKAQPVKGYSNDETTSPEKTRKLTNDTCSVMLNEMGMQPGNRLEIQESRSEGQAAKLIKYQNSGLNSEYPSSSNKECLQYSDNGQIHDIAPTKEISDELSVGRKSKDYPQAQSNTMAARKLNNHVQNKPLSDDSKDVHVTSHDALDRDLDHDISQKSQDSKSNTDVAVQNRSPPFMEKNSNVLKQQEPKTYRDVSEIFQDDKPSETSNNERFVSTQTQDCTDVDQSQTKRQSRSPEISTSDDVVAVPADMPPTTSTVKLERISTPTSRQLSTPESRLTTPSGVMTRYNEVVTQLPQVLSPSLPDHPPYTIVDRPKKEKVKRSKKEAKEVERKQSASPARSPVPAQSSDIEPVVLDKSPVPSPIDGASLPPLELPPLPEIKDEPKESKNKDSNRTQIQTGQKLKPVHAPLPKKNVSKANLKTPLSKPKKRGKSAAEAPVTSDEMKELQDPLDFLKQYCIIHQDRLPFYERIYTNIIECQSPRYDRERPLSPRTGMPMDPIPEWGEHEINMFHDMIVINRGQDSSRIGLTAAEQYLEKICYTLEILSKKKQHISDDLEELDNSKTKKIADRGRELVRDIHRPDYVKKEKKSKKKKKKKEQGSPVQLLRPDDITDAIIVSRIEDKLLKTICKEPEIFQLEVEMQRCKEKLAEIDERIVQLDGEKNILGMYCMQVFFMEQNDNRKPLEFRRAQSALYSKLHPHLDIEMNMEELEGALQLINSNLLSEREFEYLFHILNLPGRRKINFQLFSIVAALSEKVTQMDPFIRKLINKMDYNALSAKMDRSKDLFQLICDGDPEPTPRGNATASNLALELMAGGLTPEHTKYVLSKFNREGTGYVDFLDFVMYIPLFIEIHERIVKDPLRLPLDVC